MPDCRGSWNDKVGRDLKGTFLPEPSVEEEHPLKSSSGSHAQGRLQRGASRFTKNESSKEDRGCLWSGEAQNKTVKQDGSAELTDCRS